MTIKRLRASLSDRYRLEHELGAGGMATVYLAQDLKHDRKVAIKVLRPELAAVIGAERFLKEVKTTANLQHPHILGLIDSGESDGFLWYAMPFVDGESLRDRLDREKQLPIGDAVRVATEVAGALDYAHRHGVIHRDIKPENILLHDGSALVADFGIALAASSAGTRMTETGMSLGTPHYMSPEKAMGEREITARSDVYALGCVLYEMLVGDPPFTGSTAQAIVAKVVTERPPSLTTQRHTIPLHLEDAVLKSLEKLPADRFATTAAFAAALADTSFATTSHATRAVASGDGRRWRRVAGGLAVALALTGALAMQTWLQAPAARPVQRFGISLPNYLPDYGNPTISPDGTRIVYLNPEGALMTRRADEMDARQIPGSENAWATSFSPDSRSIAFNTGFPGALKVIDLETGTVRTVVTGSTFGYGTAWSDDGWIYYLKGETYGHDLMRIPESGGVAERIATPDSSANALFFFSPQALPGGRSLLVTVVPYTGEASIGVLDIATGTVTTVTSGTRALYARTGHLVVVQEDGQLRAARFDASQGKVLGSFVNLDERINLFSVQTSTMSLSNEGTLLYEQKSRVSQVVRVTRDGKVEAVDPSWNGIFQSVTFSPEGDRLAVSIVRGGRSELWMKDLRSGSLTKLSAGATQNYRPSWPNGREEVLFIADLEGDFAAYRVPADGSAPPTRLLPAVTRTIDEVERSADGTWIIYRGGSGGGRDIYAARAGIDSVGTAIVDSPAEEFSPTLSPDGRWLAYGSDETGRTEVYVRPFPNTTSARYSVSSNGGSEPTWSHSGRELFFRDGSDQLIAATVAPGATFRIAATRVLFSIRGYTGDNRNRGYGVAPDDQSFIFVAPVDAGVPTSIVGISLNWFEYLRQKVGP